MTDPSVSYMQGAGYSSTANDGYQRSANKLQETQAQVDQVVGIMRDNMERVLERDQKLSDLDYRAESLQVGAQQFERATTRIRRKYWWKNMKMMIILAVVILVVLGIIIAVIVTSVKKNPE